MELSNSVFVAMPFAVRQSLMDKPNSELKGTFAEAQDRNVRTSGVFSESVAEIAQRGGLEYFPEVDVALAPGSTIRSQHDGSVIATIYPSNPDTPRIVMGLPGTAANYLNALRP